MARVQYGVIITDLIGSIGGLTFQHIGSGKIVRIKPMPSKKSTTKQQAKHTEFTNIIRSWYALTLSDKTAWGVFAAANTKLNVWNEEKVLNAYNWFLSINSWLTLIGETPLTLPPVYATPLAVPDYTLVFEYDELTVNWSPDFVHANEYLLLYTSPPLRSISPYDRKQLRLTSIIAPATTTSYDFETDYETTHGLTLPITGGDETLNMISAVMTVHETKGLGCVYNLQRQEYNPP